MAESRKVVVLAGPTHADGRAQLEREVDVILCEEETEEAFVKVASGAHGILFRAKPRASETDNPLFNLENMVCSSHVAGVTKEASRTASLQVTAEMLRVLRGEMPDVLVNPEVKARLGLN